MTGITKYCIAAVSNTGLVARLIYCTTGSYCQEEASAHIGILSRSEDAVRSGQCILIQNLSRMGARHHQAVAGYKGIKKGGLLF